MKAAFKGIGYGGGTEIKLQSHLVNGKVSIAQTKLAQLELPQPTQSTGRNNLSFTKEWKEREKMIHQFLNQYQEAVAKNLVDTKANIRKLKEQDEVLGRG